MYQKPLNTFSFAFMNFIQTWHFKILCVPIGLQELFFTKSTIKYLIFI